MENLEIPKGSKAEIYEALIPQIQALIEGESDLYANLANISAALKEAFNHFWVGFYLVKHNNSKFDDNSHGKERASINNGLNGDYALITDGTLKANGTLKGYVGSNLKDSFISESILKEKYSLVLGPFQGPVACTRIAYGRGVCGTAWKEKRTLVVPDVDKFPGHIACSSLSKSEIVVPLFYNEQVIAVLDIDSMELNSFDQTDAHYLEQLFKMSPWLKFPTL